MIDLAETFFATALHLDLKKSVCLYSKGATKDLLSLTSGISNSPAIHHQHVVHMLNQLNPQGRPFVFSYVDNILIFGGKEAQTQTLMRKLLAISQETGFKVVLEKVRLVLPQVSYLGIVVGQEGRQADQRKVRVLIKMSPPSCNPKSTARRIQFSQPTLL